MAGLECLKEAGNKVGLGERLVSTGTDAVGLTDRRTDRQARGQEEGTQEIGGQKRRGLIQEPGQPNRETPRSLGEQQEDGGRRVLGMGVLGTETLPTIYLSSRVRFCYNLLG